MAASRVSRGLTPRRYRLGIRARTLWGLAALLAVLLAGSAMLLADSWTKLRSATQAETRNRIAGELVQAALNLGAERGMTNGTLNSAPPPSQRVVDRIMQQREASAARLRTALEEISDNPHALNADTTADLLVAAGKLEELRALVDAEVQLPFGDRDRLFVTEWRPAMSDLIEALRAAVDQLVSPATAPDTELQTVLEFRMAAFDLRNAAGERAALTAGVLGAQRAVSRSEAVLIGSRREATQLTWSRLRRLSEVIADSRIDDAMAAAQGGYFADYGGLLDRITAAGLDGTAYPIALPAFFLETEAALQSLDGLMSMVQLLSAEMSAQRVAGAQTRLYLIVAAIAAGLLLVLLPAFAFSRRVLRPIEEITDAMRRLAAGRAVDADLPVTQPDEIGEMSRAIAAFRDSMLASQTALSAAETFTRQTIDALPSLVAVLDGIGVIIAANKSWREFAAAAAGPRIAVEGQSYLQVCDESAASGDECAAAIASGLRAVIAGTRTEFESEYPCASPAGPAWYRMRVSRFGEPAARIVVIHDDITGRKRAEEGLQERNRLLELAERMSSTGHWRLDLSGGELRWSSEIYRIFGQSPADFTPDVKSTLAACVPEDRYSLVAVALEALRSGAGFSRDLRMFRSDGQFLSVEIMAGCEKNADGRVTALFGVLRDVSERKKTEEHLADVNIELERRVAAQTAALSAREAYLRGILDNVAEMVMTINEESRIESFNPAAERAFGYAAEEMIGRPVDLLARSDSECTTETGISGHLRPELAVAGDGASREIVALRKDGTSMPVELTVAGMRIAGRILYIAAMRDITKRKGAERALKERAALLHRTQDLAGIGHWRWRRDRQSGGWHTGLEYSRSVAALYGVEPEELVVPDEVYIARFIHAEDREVVAAAFRDFKRRRREREPLEYRIVRPDGAIRHVREVTENVPEGSDDPAEVLGTIQDITGRKRAELALRDSEARLRAIFDHAPVTISLRDVDARYVMVNRRFQELFGLPEREIIGRAPGQFYPPPHGDEIGRAIDRVRLTGETVITEEMTSTVEGNVRALTTRFPVTDASGRLTGIGSISVDVTEQRAAEAALRASEARLRTIFESEPECVALLGRDGALLEINPAGLAMIEAAGMADIPGRRLDALVEPEYRGAFRDLIAAVFEGGSGSLLFEITGLAGGRRWMEMNAVPLRGPEGAIGSVLGIARDVTGQRDMEERLRQAQKMEAVGQLTGGIAHDFNNLLGVIVGNLDLLSLKLVGGSMEHELVERAIAAAERGGQLTHRLLAFARRQTLLPQQVEAGELVVEVAQLLRRTIGERIELVVEIEPRLPTCYVDPGQLETALLNLAINARDAMPEGGTLTIAAAGVAVGEKKSGGDGRAAAAAGPTTGDYIVISVTDTGQGMDDKVRERAFEPFFTTKGVGKGSGLGLSMVYGFVQQSGGHLKLDSAPGRGTTVSLFLKVCGPSPPVTTSPPAKPPAQGGGELILVVEDDEEMRSFAVGALKRLGYRTVEAVDGGAALAVLHDHGEIAALFTDVMLPGALNGFALAGKIRSLRPEMPVLYTSGFADSDRLPPELLAGEVELLPKPYRVSDLGLRLERLLKRQPPRGA